MSAPAWLFAPGFACTSDIWEGAQARLPDVRVLTLDWPRGLATVSAAADYLRQIIDREQPAGLVGHSMGGMLTLELLVSGRLGAVRPLIIDAFLATPAPLFRNFVHGEDPALEVRVRAMIDGIKPLMAPLQKALQTWETPAEWVTACLDSPARYIYGGRGADRDRVLEALGWPPGRAEVASIDVISETSHFLMLEKPDAFYSCVRRFIEEPDAEQ